MLEDSDLEALKSTLKDEFSDYSELAGGKEYRYHHLVAVRKYSRNLMQKPEIKQKDFDRKVVEIAALFHDIGRSQDIEDGRMDPFESHEGHDERGAEIVDNFIQDFVTDNQLQKIKKVIYNHHSEPETVEGKIVQDSDELFKYGAHDLWRLFHYAAENNRDINQSIEYFEETLKPRREEELQDDFYFKISEKIARDRLNSYNSTVNIIEKELQGRDI